MDLAVDGSSAYIEVGEIKSVAEYSVAVTQLGIRLAVLKHAANIITGVNEKNIRLCGRLFLPAYNGFQAVDATQRRIAERKWNYTLHVAEISDTSYHVQSEDLFLVAARTAGREE